MIIYKATNKISQISYIGQTIKKLKYRKQDHKSAAKRNPKYYFHRAIRKYGWKNFEWKILEECDSKEELDEMEFHYIKQYDTYHNGYNLTLGGEGNPGWIPSEETKEKISKAHKGKKLSEETKQKLRKANSGENHPFYGKKRPDISKKYKGEGHPFYGKKHTEETKKKISEKLKGRIPPNKNIPMSVEQKLKLSKLQKGRILTEETKRKISSSLKGIRRSEETRGKISEARKGMKFSELHTENIGLSKIGNECRSKQWDFKYNGMPISIRNLKKFCRSNNLDYKPTRNKIISGKEIL